MRRNRIGWKITAVFFLLAGLGALTWYQLKRPQRTSLPQPAASPLKGTLDFAAGKFTGSLGTKWYQAEPGSTFARFADWADHFMQAASAEAKAALEAEGVEL